MGHVQAVEARLRVVRQPVIAQPGVDPDRVAADLGECRRPEHGTPGRDQPPAGVGRNPDDIVVMPGITVFVGDTDDEGREIERETQLADQDFDRVLGELGRPFAWHDFRQYDLDAPFPDVLHVAERGLRTHAEQIVKLARDNNYTLRPTVQQLSAPKPSPSSAHPRPWRTCSSAGPRSAPWTGATSTSGTRPSSAGSPKTSCRSCACQLPEGAVILRWLAPGWLAGSRSPRPNSFWRSVPGSYSLR